MTYFNMRNFDPEDLDQLIEFGVMWDYKSAVVRTYNAGPVILGFYGVRVQLGGRLFVERFIVRPDHRNQGIGLVMHQDLLKIAQKSGVKTLVMVVHECNKHIKFLKSWGWKAVGLQKGCFGNRDGYIFQRGVTI